MSHSIQAVRGFGTSLLSPLPRSDEPELLDAPEPDPAELAENFRDIQRVNHLLGGTSIILRHLPPLLAAIPARQPVTLLDLATGVADIPLAIVRWAERRDLAVTIVASDSSIPVLNLAQERIAAHPALSLARYDARAVPLPDKRFDIVLCSLALHHFAPDDACQVLREMDRLARAGFILNDLRRGRPGYAAAWIASRLTTRNRLTRHDAPLSVRRAYTPAELASLLRRAGVSNVTITTHPWFRMAALKVSGDHHA
ncbi:MAG: methyltransferase domain-containing protein [Chloroflexota bacterium]|nr:methyltransferase domain-containing protein [Chloroflexota bacterium]